MKTLSAKIRHEKRAREAIKNLHAIASILAGSLFVLSVAIVIL